ncbi:metal ABC transporter permease [Sinorhizobium meliloti]|uniref:Zinc ABC transporter permease n=1 Tax=Rhizobium meliloti TaxID=382 RepID=A0A2J0YU13_RHIML|nr:metal ABC transporter permease [Sinorhizobium meliloti]PJR09900.1 zinc ABC transporter permease [Sinorhizobium meliloti]
MTPLYQLLREIGANLSFAGYLPDAFRYDFFANAVICALIIGPLLGWLGTMVVVKRMAFFSQAVGNAALTGVAIGVMLGEAYTAPYVSMFSFCLLFALIMKYTQFRTSLSNDVLIGVFLSISLALGSSLLLFVSARINTHVMESVLFGSILTVNDTDISILLAVAAVTLSAGLWLYNQMLLASLNPSLAAARGIPVRFIDYVLVVLVALVTVACVKIVGAVLVEALLIIPAAAARNISRSLVGFVWYSVIIATFACLTGIYIPMAYDLPLPSGGAIILVAALAFVGTVLIRSTLGHFKESRI